MKRLRKVACAFCGLTAGAMLKLTYGTRTLAHFSACRTCSTNIRRSFLWSVKK